MHITTTTTMTTGIKFVRERKRTVAKLFMKNIRLVRNNERGVHRSNRGDEQRRLSVNSFKENASKRSKRGL